MPPYHREFGSLRHVSRSGSFTTANRAAIEAPPVGAISTYDDLRLALNKRRVEIGLTFEELDDRSGLPDRYTTKLLSRSPSPHGRYARNIGPLALDCLLPALRVRLRLEPLD